MANNTLELFYTHLKNLDAEALIELYHPDALFEDPAFGRLKGERIKNMWRMLLDPTNNSQLSISYSNVICDGITGTASWEANYIFTVTGRKICNKITSTFELKDGLIIKHDDKFELYKWAKQALGLTGYLVGWTKFFQQNLQGKTHYKLDKFEEKLNG
ncbi:MAG: nuclear transport factor 2 family protein [Flavobacteriales bacterium]|nr:nuclear transport factor 2 family protein [Flavobacteriales bacterium]